MEWWLILLLIFGGLIATMSTGIPVAFAFAAVNIVGILILYGGPKGLMLLSGSIATSVSVFTFIAVPMFFLLGEVLFRSRVVEMVIDVVDSWIGKMRARLLYVAMAAGTLLAALSGAGMADTALLGSTLQPELEKRGYDRRLSLGSIMSAGLLATIIPPSALAVLVGGLAEVSIARLLMAGVMPGLLMVTIYVIYIAIRVRRNPALAPTYASVDIPLRTKLWGTAKLTPLSVIIVMVIGFILLGITTPSEAAATGALGAIIVVALYGRLNFEVLRTSLLGTLQIAGVVFIIITGSTAFGQVLAMTGATREFLDFIVALRVSPVVIVIFIQLAIVFLGFFMDQVSIMLVSIPVILPVVQVLDIDPIWFWLLFLMNMSIGTITPPFGLVLFALKGVVPQASMADLYRAAIPFVILDLVAMGIIIAFPSIATWLPSVTIG